MKLQDFSKYCASLVMRLISAFTKMAKICCYSVLFYVTADE